MLTIDATYDMDGDFATPAGQSPMTYEVELDGASEELSPATATTAWILPSMPVGSDATLTITPAEWETPVTQTIEVGA